MIIVVIYIVFIIIYAMFKKVNAFDSFGRGVESNYSTIKNIFPTIMALIISINVFVNSGIIDILKNAFPNLFIVPELILQACLRPLSHSSAMLIMVKTFESYGVNSIPGKIASILQGCNDTTIYIIALYFGSIKMNNVGRTLKIGLLNDLITFIFVFILCTLFYNN